MRIAPGLMKASALDLYDYPWSHSLVALAGWGALFGGVHWLVRRDTKAAVVIGFCVVSHWFLDVLMHRPDVPLFPRGPYLGLGLWNSLPGTFAVEGAIYLIGIFVYARWTRPKDRVGVWSLWLLLGILTALWVGAAVGPPPPDPRALAISSAVMGWLIVLPWGYWIDRHRTLRGGV